MLVSHKNTCAQLKGQYLENLGHYGICSLEDDAPIKKEIPSHHLENKGFLQSISRNNDDYRKVKSDIILMNTLSIEGMFPGFPSCFQLYIVSCWIYLAVFSNVPSCFSTFAARGIAVANSAPHSQQQTFTELFRPREGWFNHENAGLSLTYMGLSTEQEILVPSYLAK